MLVNALEAEHRTLFIKLDASVIMPVDLLRPSADKATGNRKNEPLDRQHCVVVQGLSESDASTPKERISADLNMLQHLLNEMLNSNEKITIRAAFRIGKKVSEQSETVRPRPLKIVLNSKEEASLLLSRKSSLRNSHKEVFFSRTILQQNV
nr:unnamed protein product [Spirometra erinaceieuropaei]